MYCVQAMRPKTRGCRRPINDEYDIGPVTMMMMMMMTDRSILREIQWLRLQQQSSASPCSSGDHAPSHQMVPSSQSAQQLVLGPTPSHLVDELRLLRRRRDELECRMVSLQSSRRQLMSQLDTLMSVLKASSIQFISFFVTAKI